MRSRANAQVNFQRRHFEAIARIIANFTAGPGELRDSLARHFASGLAYTNPNFDRDKFIQWANGDERSESDIRRAEIVKRRAEREANREAKRDAKARREAAKPPFTLQELQKAAYQIVRDRNKALDKLES